MSKNKWFAILFYSLVASAILLLMFPDFFAGLYHDRLEPMVDRLTMNWLQDRGKSMTEEEQNVESES